MNIFRKTQFSLIVTIVVIVLVIVGNLYYNNTVKKKSTDIDLNLSSEEKLNKYVGKLQSGGRYIKDTKTICMSAIYDSIIANKINTYFQLDTLYSKNASTWDKALAIAKFVARNIPHNNQKIQPKMRNAIALWEYTKSVEPAFNCRLHSIMTYELLQSVGIEARFITCMPEDKNDQDCHVVNHVWLPELNKWAMIDSDSGGNWASDEKGVPMSLQELRENYIYGSPIYYHPEFKGPSNEKGYYYAYMAKNLYWFSSWETHHYNQESNISGGDVGRYINLVPNGYKPFSIKSSSIITSDDKLFWAAPTNSKAN